MISFCLQSYEYSSSLTDEMRLFVCGSRLGLYPLAQVGPHFSLIVLVLLSFHLLFTILSVQKYTGLEDPAIRKKSDFVSPFIGFQIPENSEIGGRGGLSGANHVPWPSLIL